MRKVTFYALQGLGFPLAVVGAVGRFIYGSVVYGGDRLLDQVADYASPTMTLEEAIAQFVQDSDKA